MTKKILGICLFLSAPSFLFSQIAAWDFTGENNVATSTAEVYNANLDASSTLTRGAGAVGSAGANSFRTTGFQNNGIALTNTDYFENQFSAAPGFTLSLTSIDARFAGTATFYATPGVSMQYAYSLDGTNFTLIGSPTIMTTTGAMPTIDLSGISALQNVTDDITVTIRFYASGQTTTGGWGYNSPTTGSYGLAFGGTLNCLVQSTFYADTDNDTFGDLNSTIQACEAPAGYVSNSTDCDDTNPAINPNTIWYLDADGDTFGDASISFTGCVPPSTSYVLNATDCDDINPNANAITTWYLDADNDGFGDATQSIQNCGQPAGYVANNLDCDDSNNAVNPSATEIFDGIDNNCDNVIDEGFILTTYYEDLDGDGYGSNISIQSVTNPGAGYSLISGDCNDNNNAINPGATEICDGIDNNCNLQIDENLPTQTFYADADNDGFGDINVSITNCSAPVGYVANSLDCDDTNDLINPNATDIPGNGIDEDCSGADATIQPLLLGMYEFTQTAACPVTATSVTTQPTNATFSNFNLANVTCSQAANVFNTSAWNTGGTIDLNEYYEFSITAADCYNLNLDRVAFNHRVSASGNTPTWIVRSSLDNYASNLGSGLSGNNNNVNLDDTVFLTNHNNISTVTFRFYLINMGANGATFRVDNVSLYGNTISLPTQTYYADSDGDGFGNPNVTIQACSPTNGYVADNSDCDDTNPAINPFTTWYLDNDNDLVGGTTSFVGCVPPSNYVLTTGDCDDNDNQILAPTNYFVDLDGDGFGSGDPQSLCSNPGAGFALVGGDCNDSNDQIYPGATEICDGLDNDCAGGIDNGLTFVTYYVDADNDGFGTGAGQSLCANPGAGFVTIAGDCNDNNNQIYPGATEILDNSIDENCDGVDGYLSVEDLTLTIFKIVPNPNNGTFVIEMNTIVSNATVTIQDVNGKAIQSSIFTGASFEANLSSLTPGIYFVKIQSENSIAIKRMVVR